MSIYARNLSRPGATEQGVTAYLEAIFSARFDGRRACGPCGVVHESAHAEGSN